jgi:hypothetical protein
LKSGGPCTTNEYLCHLLLPLDLIVRFWVEDEVVLVMGAASNAVVVNDDDDDKDRRDLSLSHDEQKSVQGDGLRLQDD